MAGPTSPANANAAALFDRDSVVSVRTTFFDRDLLRRAASSALADDVHTRLADELSSDAAEGVPLRPVSVSFECVCLLLRTTS